jgi:hypothetical protein
VCNTVRPRGRSGASFDAFRGGLARASKTLQNVSGAWIKDQEVLAKNGTII